MLDDAVNKVKELFNAYNNVIVIADKVILEDRKEFVEHYKRMRNLLNETRMSMKKSK